MPKDRELWSRLFEIGPIRRPKPTASLYEVIAHVGDLDLAKRYVEGGHDISRRLVGGHSLSLAVMHGDLEFVRYFIDNAPDLDHANTVDGANDLLSSAVERLSKSDDSGLETSIAVLAYLLEKPELRPQMAAAFMTSAATHQVTAAEMLLEAGLEDEDVRTGPDTFTPLAKHLEDINFPEFAALLKGKPVDIEALRQKQSAEREEAAALAGILGSVTSSASKAKLEGAELESSYRALVDETRAGKWTAALDSLDPHDQRSVIEFAAQCGFDDLVSAIFDVGAPAPRAAYQAAIAAAVYGHLDVLRTLESNGVAIEKTSKDRNSPLSEACRYGHLDIVSYLLELGADPDAGESSGHGFTMDQLAGGENRGRIIAALDHYRANPVGN